MPYYKLKAIIEKMYGPSLELRAILPPAKRHAIYSKLVLASTFLLMIVAVLFFAQSTILADTEAFAFLKSFAERFYGVFLVVFSFTFVFGALEAMHRSYYFTGLQQVLSEAIEPDFIPTTWEVATIVFETTDDDITGGFINSTMGQEILYRVGVNEDMFADYDAVRTTRVDSGMFVVERDKGVVLATYAKSIYKNDPEFRLFLAKNNINEEQLIKAAEWVTNIERKEKRLKRWWSKDNLGQIPGIGKSWGYGETYYLNKYGHEITADSIWDSALMTRREEDDEVEELEQILSRSRQSNALMLTNDTLNARRRTAQLYYKIREGKALPPIEDRRVFYLDIEAVVIATGDKQLFENELVHVFNQAIQAGNIIVYVEHIATSIQSTKVLGVDLIELLRPYFESSDMQLVVGEISENFDKFLSRDTRITQAFDVIEMKDVALGGVFELLQQRAQAQEKRTGIVFTVPALEKTGELADRYFPTGVMPDKAFDLLEELIPMAYAEGISQVTQKEVERLVTRKTKVPTGEPEQEEREKLLKLEDFLHKRVVAQERAIEAVSHALRRSRSGVTNPKKPMGTFLFLGPTGVGKTETAKALAEILFNDEEAMIRLDMSEFQSPYALDELVGVAGTEQSGRLETLIRKRQYGVLLLDEFEKSHKTVQDLFLQILDEGHYTNAAGKIINMRNLLIIATSNAGADMIWEMEKEGKNVSDSEKVLVDYIISKGLYRPELLNRFDEIVVFHVLTPLQVRKIAELHVKSFAKRVLKEQNITVRITEKLINHVAEKGYDPQFGGRPLERAIKSEVEQQLADEILKGTIHSGDTFEFK
jgi:ATP-dependent Clp protease ATP-binding subunit ClpA